MSTQERSTISWRSVVALLAVGVLWASFWVHHEITRPRPAATPPTKPPSELCKEFEAFLEGIETNQRTVDSLFHHHFRRLAEDGRRLVLKRAVDHALRFGSASGWLPLLFEWRHDAAPLIESRLRADEGGIAALETFAALFIDGSSNTWCHEVTETGRQAVYRLLAVGLDEPDAEPAQSVRSTAVGLVARVGDREAIPAIERIVDVETNRERRVGLQRLLDRLVNREP